MREHDAKKGSQIFPPPPYKRMDAVVYADQCKFTHRRGQLSQLPSGTRVRAVCFKHMTD